MNTSNSTPNLPFSLINSALQALSCLLPGLLLIKTLNGYALLAIYLFLYIWLSCFTFDLARIGNRWGRKVKVGHLFVKFILSFALIVLFSSKTSWNFGIILLAFEVFQWLLILNLKQIGSNLWFLLTNTLYYGFIFNLILIVYAHNHFSFSLMLPLLFAFLLAMTVILSKHLFDLPQQHNRFMVVLLRIISLLGALAAAYYANFTKHLPDWTFYSIAIGLVVTFFLSKLFAQPRKRELSMQGFVLILLALYYFFYH